MSLAFITFGLCSHSVLNSQFVGLHEYYTSAMINHVLFFVESILICQVCTSQTCCLDAALNVQIICSVCVFNAIKETKSINTELF